jgi:hypothetical protein
VSSHLVNAVRGGGGGRTPVGAVPPYQGATGSHPVNKINHERKSVLYVGVTVTGVRGQVNHHLGQMPKLIF